MELNELSAISPIDGRYRNKTLELSAYFSEFGLIKYRVLVEIEYFIKLTSLPIPTIQNFPLDAKSALRNKFKKFSISDAQKIKDIEKVTNHDVKAVEYYLREVFDELGLQEYKEFIHFGLTSQDVNNTAIPLSLKDCHEKNILKGYTTNAEKIKLKAEEWKSISMLARTHGQPASPTSLGKEMQVFVERLNKELEPLKTFTFYGKFGGATGNFNAHYVAYPEIDWMGFADEFLNDLGLKRNQFTTQIDHYDDLSRYFDNLKRINVILTDFCKDIWSYISLDYFTQKIKAGEVGSSAMPHKVNPIDFENAEGNLGIANTFLNYLSEKLPVSRLQRDLTDSTVLRNIGVPLSHIMIAIDSIKKGMDKLIVNQEKIDADLTENWAVVAEAIQTILRSTGYPDAYNKLKEFSRGKGKLKQADFEEFISGLEVNKELKTRLKSITPFNYTGKVPW